MKKIIIALSILCIANISFAQIRREVPANPNTNADSTQKISRKIMMDELNLTKAQRVQMKQIQQTRKAQRDAIMNNDSLTVNQKQAMLKQLHKATAKDINTILTDEQREKLKEMKQENKYKKENNFNNSMPDSTQNNIVPN
jgi:Spy/CpxP family protein refolding chaperone